jgi:hypothetical protein
MLSNLLGRFVSVYIADINPFLFKIALHNVRIGEGVAAYVHYKLIIHHAGVELAYFWYTALLLKRYID